MLTVDGSGTTIFGTTAISGAGGLIKNGAGTSDPEPRQFLYRTYYGQRRHSGGYREYRSRNECGRDDS